MIFYDFEIRQKKSLWAPFLLDNVYLFLVDMQEAFMGNVDQHTAKTNSFEIPINATYVRIYPLKWKRLPCLRFELLGAKGMMKEKYTWFV